MAVHLSVKDEIETETTTTSNSRETFCIYNDDGDRQPFNCNEVKVRWVAVGVRVS